MTSAVPAGPPRNTWLRFARAATGRLKSTPLTRPRRYGRAKHEEIEYGRRKGSIITGASKGIDAAIAKRLAGDGFSVVVNYAGSEGEANGVVRGIEAAGGRALAVKADFSDAAAVASMFDQAAFGTLTALVNNAGIMKLAPLAATDDALFERHVEVNLRGTFLCMREAVRRFAAGGRIVSFSSSIVGFYQPWKR